MPEEKNKEKKEEKSTRLLDYKTFITHRNNLIQGGNEQTRSFDKHVIAISSGALGVSLILLKDIVGCEIHKVGLLYWAWGLLVTSMFFTLFSFLIGKLAFSQIIWQMDKAYSSDKDLNSIKVNRSWSIGGWILNVTSGIACLAGVSMLCLFVIENM